MQDQPNNGEDPENAASDGRDRASARPGDVRPPQRLLPSPREAFHKGSVRPLEDERGKSASKRKKSDEDNDRDNSDDQASDKDDSKDTEDTEKEKQPFWKRPILMAVICGAALLLVVTGVVIWLAERNYEHTDDAFIDGHIVHVAPRVAGRVLRLNVNDNQQVTADTVVIDIDPAPFQAQLDNAQAMLAQSQSKVSQAQADLTVQQSNVEQAKAGVVAAEADAANADLDYARYHKLEPAARVEQQVDAIDAKYRTAHAQLTEAQKRVTSAEAQVQSAQTAIEAARAQVLATKAQVREAELNLSYCRVTAGQAGYVTRRTVEAGNYVQMGQEMMTVVSPAVWVTANFKETQLTYMRPGQPVRIEVDSYPQRYYRGHVDSLATGTGAVFSVLPPENATGNFVKIVQRVPVKIVFDETIDHVLAPGESVDARADITSGR